MPSKAENIAREIHSWAQDAVGDCAACEFYNEGVSRGKQDARADDIYSSPDQMSDLLGDRIYDESRGDKKLRGEIIDELSKLMRHLPKSMWDELRR